MKMTIDTNNLYAADLALLRAIPGVLPMPTPTANPLDGDTRSLVRYLIEQLADPNGYIKAIKAYRELTNDGLTESKNALDKVKNHFMRRGGEVAVVGVSDGARYIATGEQINLGDKVVVAGTAEEGIVGMIMPSGGYGQFDVRIIYHRPGLLPGWVGCDKVLRISKFKDEVTLNKAVALRK
jgi:hypothetical protein